MFFWSNSKVGLRPRTSFRKVDEVTTPAQIQLEQREMLAGLNVGDTFINDQTGVITVAEPIGKSKFSGVIIGFNFIPFDVTIKCKPNGQFTIKGKNEPVKGKLSLKAVPVANSNPEQVVVNGTVKFKPIQGVNVFPNATLDDVTFTQLGQPI